MKYLLYKDDFEEDWFIPRSDDRYEFYVKSSVCWRNCCDVRTVRRTVRKIRNYGRNNLPLRVTNGDWQLICGKYPWMARYDNEVQHKLGTLLLVLFALSIREGMQDVEEEIISQNQLDEEGLRALTVGEGDREIELCIFKNRLRLEKGRLDARLKWEKNGYGSDCIYHENEGHFFEGGRRHYLTEMAADKIRGVMGEVRDLKAKALSGEEGFLLLETQEDLLAFRPMPKDTRLKELDAFPFPGWNRKYYQFLAISKSADRVEQTFCEWRDILDAYNGIGFCIYDTYKQGRCRETFLNEHAAAVMKQAREAGDLYLLYMMKSMLHQQTEDECEYLAQMDGDRHYVDWQEERTVDDLIILHSQCGGFSMFNRWPRYFCRIRIDGNEYDTVWDPRHPDEIRITVYHHIAVLHLNEEQVRYFWEKTDADPDSKPIMGMPQKK